MTEKQNLKMLCSAAVILFAAAGFVRAQGDGWVNVSDKLTNSLPDYDDSVPGARRIGGIAVDRHTGDVIAGLNGPPFGLYRSKDAGATWQRIDGGNVAGGWTRSYSIQVGQDKPGRIAAFRVGPPAPTGDRGKAEPSSAYTLDGGKTWTQIKNVRRVQGFSGMPHGMIDWTSDPVTIVSQGRSRPEIQVTRDDGEKWEKLKTKKISGLIDFGRQLKYQRKHDKRHESIIHGYGITGKALLFGKVDGIYRSEDDGKTLNKVSDFIATGITPIAFGGKLYWATEKGVAVSPDEGKSWSIYGSELPNVRKGPFFGKDPSAMVVVTDDGVFKTVDSAQTWTKVSELYTVPDAYRLDWPPVLLRTDYAWDHTRNLLYVAGFAGSAYKKEIK